MGKSMLLQILNGYVAVTAMVACLMFARYIYRNINLGYYELRAPIVLFVLCIGTVMFRGPVFVARTLINMGYQVNEPVLAYILGGLLLEAAFLCAIRVFAPTEWGSRVVIGTFLLSTIAVFVSTTLVIWR